MRMIRLIGAVLLAAGVTAGCAKESAETSAPAPEPDAGAVYVPGAAEKSVVQGVADNAAAAAAQADQIADEATGGGS